MDNRKHETKPLENCPVNNLAVRQTFPNEPSPIPATRKVQLANRGPDASPWHFCLRVQQGPGKNSDASTGGRSGHGRNARFAGVQRMGGDLGWLRQCSDPTTGLKLHNPAKLQRAFARTRM